jgi:RNA polymerase sigma-70 factor (ECF subfamily)
VDEDLAPWLSAARAGSNEALGKILEACRWYLLVIAQDELDPALRAKCAASDLVQETFVKAQRHFAQFQGQSATELRGWLRQMLLHNLADTRRSHQTDKRRLNKEVAVDDGAAGGAGLGGLIADVLSPSAEVMEQEQAEALRQALARLPEDYRLVIQYRYQEERSFEDIGRLLNLTPNAARKLWLRAMDRLKQETGRPP